MEQDKIKVVKKVESFLEFANFFKEKQCKEEDRFTEGNTTKWNKRTRGDTKKLKKEDNRIVYVNKRIYISNNRKI